MQNLRDKLLKAGLVTEQQTRTAEDQSKNVPSRPSERKDRPPPRSAADRPPPRSAAPVRQPERRTPIADVIPKLPPLPGSKEHQRLESVRQQALNKQLRELVKANEVSIEGGTQAFYFMTRKNKARRMELPLELTQQLEAGVLAIVERPEPAQIEHSVVPAAIAEKVLELFPKGVRFFNRPGNPVGILNDDDAAPNEPPNELPVEPS